MTLRRKIITLACIAAVVPVIVMLAITSMLENKLEQTVATEVKSLITEHVSQVALDAYEECRNTDRVINTDTNRALKGSLGYLRSFGSFDLSKSKVKRVTSITEVGNSTTLNLPEMSFGGQVVSMVKDPEKESFPVDGVREMTGAQCTVFQRINPEGDMLAVASTELDAKGARKVGYIKRAFGSDGKSRKAIMDVLSGDNSSERGDGEYGTRLILYAPLKDNYGYISGMIGVYLNLNIVEDLLKGILKTSVGKSGYIWLIGTRGAYKNKYIFLPSSGKGDSNLDSAEGTELVKSFVSSARDAGAGKLTSIKYEWADTKNGPKRDKYALYSYFKPWGWVIGAGVYMDDYQGVSQKLTGTMDNLTDLLILSGVIILILVLGVSFYMSGLIANPISHMANIAAMIASGDIHEASKSIMEVEQICHNARRTANHSEDKAALDETGRLFLTIKEMAYNLDSLVGQVQRSGIQVTTSATEIAASARQLDETVNTQAVATNQISATSLEISANAGELAGTMDKVHRSAKGAADLAEEGKDGLRSMIRIMDDLSSATDTIIEKLASINTQAISIVYIVTTITKVADRTNLLSLNAAIEAEKAGKYGQGFSVVADEIRRLADQTSVAALEIENMISSMREAVDSGVMEIDRFAKEVHHGAEKAAKLGKKLDGIMQSVTELNPRIQSVNEGMNAQAEGAQQISQSMTQLSDSASQTSDSLGEFNRATSQLNEAVQGLQNEVSKFKVS